MLKLALRTLGMVIGLVGAVLMLIVDILYSLVHTLERMAGYSPDTTHFFIGLVLTLVGLVGAFLADPLPEASLVLMLVALVGFFFVSGAWAIIPGVFFLLAIIIVFVDRGRRKKAA